MLSQVNHINHISRFNREQPPTKITLNPATSHLGGRSQPWTISALGQRASTRVANFFENNNEPAVRTRLVFVRSGYLGHPEISCDRRHRTTPLTQLSFPLVPLVGHFSVWFSASRAFPWMGSQQGLMTTHADVFFRRLGRITGRVGEERSSVLPTLLAVCGSVYDRWGPKELGKVNKSMTE
jgi:hypothetical protein